MNDHSATREQHENMKMACSMNTKMTSYTEHLARASYWLFMPALSRNNCGQVFYTTNSCYLTQSLQKLGKSFTGKLDTLQHTHSPWRTYHEMTCVSSVIMQPCLTMLQRCGNGIISGSVHETSCSVYYRNSVRGTGWRGGNTRCTCHKLVSGTVTARNGSYYGKGSWRFWPTDAASSGRETTKTNKLSSKRIRILPSPYEAADSGRGEGEGRWGRGRGKRRVWNYVAFTYVHACFLQGAEEL